MEIGEYIKKFRELRGFTLPDLATRAGVSKAFLWEIESGKSRRPGAEVQDLIEPEINTGLRAFINERKLQGRPLEPEEIKSLSFVQLKGGRPTTKEQWALVYGMLREITGDTRG